MSSSYILERVRFQSGQVVCTVWPVFYTTSGLTFLFITDFEQKHGFGPGASMSLVDIPFKRNSCRTPVYSQINVPVFHFLYILVTLIFSTYNELVVLVSVQLIHVVQGQPHPVAVL